MDQATYRQRRQVLRQAVSDGAILLVSASLPVRNYRDNNHPFRQDSHFLYYLGISEPDLALLLLPDGRELLLAAAEDPDHLVWFGPHPTVSDHAAAAGVAETGDLADLPRLLGELQGKGLRVHYLPPYSDDRTLILARLLAITVDQVAEHASEELVEAVARQRLIKTDAEVAEVEAALAVTAEMYQAAMAATAPGRTEAEVAAALLSPVLKRGLQTAFPPIVTVRGEVLHNTSVANTLGDGDLLLIDSGAESARWYASDITRTFPVSGRFSQQQQEIYEIVLKMQQTAISNAAPKVSNRDLHLQAARIAADGLKAIGLLQGDPDEIVAVGAHALFYPHGLGHALGLDVHDMEDLGDVVGYLPGESRSSQFGLAFLRFARPLEPGHIITVEPGLYFIPALIDRWAAEGRHKELIRYDRLEPYRGFGGIRIEDNVLITERGGRVLGPGIPKTIPELEQALTG